MSTLHYADMKSGLAHDGFLYLAEIASIDELGALEQIIDGLFFRKGAQVSQRTRVLSGSENGQTIELNNILSLAPELKASPLYQRILAISREVCGPGADYIHDHAIYKSSGSGSSTPWHQDAAISLGRFLYSRKLHWWIPFQMTTPDAGALQFVRGSHRGKIFPHYLRRPQIDIDAVIQREIDSGSIQQLTYQLGSASAHLPRTLHHASSNYSLTVRKAWGLQFGVYRPSFMKTPAVECKRLFGQFGSLRNRA